MKQLLLLICVLIIISLCGCEEDTPSSPKPSSEPYEGMFYILAIEEDPFPCSRWNLGDSIEVRIDGYDIYFGGKKAKWNVRKERGYFKDDYSYTDLGCTTKRKWENEIIYDGPNDFVAYVYEHREYYCIGHPGEEQYCTTRYKVEAFKWAKD